MIDQAFGQAFGQGVLVIPLDILILIIVFAIFAILYVNLLHSLRIKKEILIQNIQKKIRNGIDSYKTFFETRDLSKELTEEMKKYARELDSSPQQDDDAILKNVKSRFEQYVTMQGLPNYLIRDYKKYLFNYVKLRVYKIQYLDHPEKLNKSRMRTLEKLDEEIDSLNLPIDLISQTKDKGLV
jgi:hypothetical protein